MFSSPARMATRRSIPKANPPCGGAPYSNGLRKKPNLRSASSSSMPISGEHPPLQVAVVDPDRPGAELPTVEHEVVGLRAHAHRIALEQVDVVGMGLRERMVTRLRTPALGVDADEHREVDDPHVAVRAFPHRRPAEVVAQLTEDLTRRRPLVGDDEHEVAIGRREPLGDRRAPRSATGTWRPATRTSRRQWP